MMTINGQNERTPLLRQSKAAKSSLRFRFSPRVAVFCRALLMAVLLTFFIFKNLVTCPFTVYIIRHAEKYPDTKRVNLDPLFRSVTHGASLADSFSHKQEFETLSPKGLSRAKHLATDPRLLSIFENAVAIYASKPNEPSWSLAQIATIGPLAEVLGHPIISRYWNTGHKVKQMIKEIKSLTSGTRVDFKKDQRTFEQGTFHQSIIICWDTSSIVRLVDLFGGCLSEWPHSDFDSILTLEFNADILVGMKRFPQNFTSPTKKSERKWKFHTGPCTDPILEEDEN